jgi:arylsulfatase A-like enzyme
VLLGEGATATRDRDLRRFRALYAASVDYLNRQVSAFVRDLLATAPETTVVVTADHGENLADDAERLFDHVSSLSEAVLTSRSSSSTPPATRPSASRTGCHTSRSANWSAASPAIHSPT